MDGNGWKRGIQYVFRISSDFLNGLLTVTVFGFLVNSRDYHWGIHTHLCEAEDGA